MLDFWNGLPPGQQLAILLALALLLAVLIIRNAWLRVRSAGNASREPALMMLTPSDAFTAHQAREGVLGVGATGSGKSSTLAHLMATFMRRDAGMLVLTAGIDDDAHVVKLAQECGRAGDVRRFAPEEPWQFDFLHQELSSAGGSVATAAQLLQDLVDHGTKMQAQNSSEPFWPLASARQLRMALTAIHRAKGPCSVTDVYRFVTSMPTRKEEPESKEFWDKYCGKTLLKADARPTHPDVQLAADYVLGEFIRMGDRTQGCIQAQTLNVLEKFMAGSVRELVASGVTNLSPQDVLDGRIVVVDLPVLKYREPGQFVQIIWKLLTQRAALRRPPAAGNREVVIWADEAQLHAIPAVDSMVQAVARKHLLVQVAITQNLPLLISVLKNRDDAIAWIANLQTKFIFANGDRETNEYFSALCGNSKHLFGSSSVQSQPYDYVGDVFGLSQTSNYTASEQMQPDVPPWAFPALRKGGKENDYTVDCFVFQGGRVFSNGKPFVKASIRQRL